MDDESLLNASLQVKISSPTGVHLDTEAKSVSAVNETGAFDILPGHRNFITLLSPCVIAVQTKQGAMKEVEITSGVMHVKNNKVDVFLHILADNSGLAT